MKFTSEYLIKITNAIVLKQAPPLGAEVGCSHHCTKISDQKFSISTDSRKITEEDFYLPLVGEKFNGHDFIAQAVSGGAWGYFTSNKHILHDDAELILYVPDTLEAYLKLAQYYKNKVNPKTIAITGSSGKTTTKEMMATVAATVFRTHKSLLNHNNEIGLAQTLLSMPEDTEVLVIEMGMRGLGEISMLSKFSEPDIAIITNIGTAHLGRLGSIENIAKAKCEIAQYLKKDGLLITGSGEMTLKHCKFDGEIRIIDISSKKLKLDDISQNSSKFIYDGNKYTLNIEGEHNILNSLFVIEAATALGIPPDKIAQGLANYRPIENRWQIETCGGYKIINDSYNANPESVKCALKTFLSLYSPPLVVVLGDMNELGNSEKEYHAEIGEFLSSGEWRVESGELEKKNNSPLSTLHSPLFLITVGNLAKIIGENADWQSVHFDDTLTAARYIKENVPKNTTILLKASRSLKFEKIIEEINRQ